MLEYVRIANRSHYAGYNRGYEGRGYESSIFVSCLLLNSKSSSGSNARCLTVFSVVIIPNGRFCSLVVVERGSAVLYTDAFVVGLCVFRVVTAKQKKFIGVCFITNMPCFAVLW